MSDVFVIPKKKDMQKVYDYEERTQLKIFRGQCFNNACALLANRGGSQVPSVIFDYAQKLYDEGIKKNWLKLVKETEE